jgi:YegS/Rv2252/BmrU family lipid kinase
MKHLFIVNPSAGKGKASSYISKIHEIFKDKKDSYKIEITERPGHATEIVKKYVSKEDYRVYSLGGDGTLNEVVNGIVGSNSSLGIIPGGTGNDFIRNIFSGKQSEFIIENTIFGEFEWIDLGVVNGRYFINISSIGIDADIANKVKLFKKKPFISGQLAYVLALFATLYEYKSKTVSIDINDDIFYMNPLLVCVANGRFYGGGMMVAPNADLKDGLFHICLIKNISKIKIPFLFPRLIKGTHESIQEVTVHKSEKVTVSSKEKLYLSLDGEIISVNNAEFSIIPKGIKIIRPKI